MMISLIFLPGIFKMGAYYIAAVDAALPLFAILLRFFRCRLIIRPCCFPWRYCHFRRLIPWFFLTRCFRRCLCHMSLPAIRRFAITPLIFSLIRPLPAPCHMLYAIRYVAFLLWFCCLYYYAMLPLLLLPPLFFTYALFYDVAAATPCFFALPCRHAISILLPPCFCFRCFIFAAAFCLLRRLALPYAFADATLRFRCHYYAMMPRLYFAAIDAAERQRYIFIADAADGFRYVKIIAFRHISYTLPLLHTYWSLCRCFHVYDAEAAPLIIFIAAAAALLYFITIWRISRRFLIFLFSCCHFCRHVCFYWYCHYFAAISPLFRLRCRLPHWCHFSPLLFLRLRWCYFSFRCCFDFHIAFAISLFSFFSLPL